MGTHLTFFRGEHPATRNRLMGFRFPSGLFVLWHGCSGACGDLGLTLTQEH